MFINEEIAKNIGLALNEAKIYEVLLKSGESSAGQVSKTAKINRRNVHDSLKRLLEKGLVFEVLQGPNTHYQAVSPARLAEILTDRQRALMSIMPQLESYYHSQNRPEQFHLYRGVEGFKNYMRDLIRIGQNYYAIGAKSSWTSPELADFLKWFIPAAKDKKIKFFILYDHEVKNFHPEIIERLEYQYKFLPPQYSTQSAINIFGDHVVTFSNAKLSVLHDDIILSIVINQRVADAYRTWFKMLWDACPQEVTKK